MPHDSFGTNDGVKHSRRRAILVLIAAFWLVAFSMLSIRASFATPWSFDIVAPRRLLTAAFGTALCLIMAFILDRLRSLTFSRRVICGLFGAFLMAILIAMFSLTLNRVIAPLPDAARITASESAQWIMVWFGYTLAWTGTHLALVYHWEAEDQLRRLLVMQELAQKSKVAALQYQINPHFLFNTLNSISALILERRTRQAEAMVLNLSTFIRAAPAGESDGMIRLGEELRLLHLYLTIEEARFSNRMRVVTDIPDALRSAMVPPLILQPLVENAVRYGVGRSEAMTTITIAAERQDQQLRLVVEDDGMLGEAPEGGTGLGLANVRERLEAHFGNRGRLTA